MVSANICGGNPGAIAFLLAAYETSMFTAEMAFQRMQRSGITGSRLYMLWNDCCNRKTELALEVMLKMSVDEIVRHIDCGAGRGIPIEEGELA